ncbi:uncharacterized protein LOC133720506 isoform X3 [Rosa rugosa]|uniref:uncharacterized protein LOC133720506 isoform X3 n=1 Tax=Rosa rugosa TaxID=74645 RepID=UPI002B408675|nr:uncharacterized protein LOC133720506 isoform X3 [Rosa rugosa]
MGRKNTNEIGGSGSQVKAVWNDYNVSKFCDLCIKLVDAGRRPNTHFDREGWESLVVNFSKETGDNYDETQLKNKWDSLKIEWKLWKELVGKETGLGWNPSKGTVDAPAEWWHSKIQVNPEYAKLRKKGLNPELEEKLDRMFSNIIATGEHAWAPSCGNLPSPKSDICKDDVIPLEGSDDSVDFTPIERSGGKEGVSRRGKKRLTDEAELQAKAEKKPKGPIVLGKQKISLSTSTLAQLPITSQGWMLNPKRILTQKKISNEPPAVSGNQDISSDTRQSCNSESMSPLLIAEAERCLSLYFALCTKCRQLIIIFQN